MCVHVFRAMVPIALLASFCNSASASDSQLWESVRIQTPPRIDGKIDDVWETAKRLDVTIREAIGADNPATVRLRALHTDDTFYVLAQWDDTTRSDMRDPYVWNDKSRQYERASEPDDQFALEFPLSGDFSLNMLSLTQEYVADVWHWKAGRGNPAGWVDDKRHIISQSPVSGGKEYSMGGHGVVYVARLMDAGLAAYTLIPKPESHTEDTVDSFAQREPTLSLADVRGKGIHDGKGWTLEMSRKFDTGHDDDAVINPAKDNICAIAILNDELYFDHSVSELITLRFLGGGD